MPIDPGTHHVARAYPGRPSRLAFAVIDQLLFSVGNTTLLFAVARVSAVEYFGAVTLVLAVLTTTLACTRGLLGNSLAVLADRPAALRREGGYAVTMALAVGGLAGCVMCLAGLALGLGTAAVLLGTGAPVVATLDTLRYFAVARGRARHATMADSIWAGGAFALLASTWFAPTLLRADTVMAIWLGLVIVSLLSLAHVSRLRPSCRSMLTWWRGSARHRYRFAAVGVIGAVGTLLILTVATLGIGTSASAALRGASSVMGPFSVVFNAAQLALVPELRRGSDDPRGAWPRLRLLGLTMSGLALAVGVVALVVPPWLGRLALGSSWTVVQPLLPITACEYAGLVWIVLVGVVLRAGQRSAALLLVRCVSTGTAVLLGTASVLAFESARAVAVALALAGVAGAIVSRLSVTPGRGQLARMTRTQA